jgi:antitoxin component of MazEF toxin-antitoxin module
MQAKIKVDAGICGFKTVITASSEDNMTVDLKVVSPCETIKKLAARYREKTPVNAYQELSPQNESVIMQISRSELVKKGCCEACVVPAAVCKAIHVAAGLALPRDVTLEIAIK